MDDDIKVVPFRTVKRAEKNRTGGEVEALLLYLLELARKGELTAIAVATASADTTGTTWDFNENDSGVSASRLGGAIMTLQHRYGAMLAE